MRRVHHGARDELCESSQTERTKVRDNAGDSSTATSLGELGGKSACSTFERFRPLPKKREFKL